MAVKAVTAFPIDSHSMSANLIQTLANISIAAPTATRDSTDLTMPPVSISCIKAWKPTNSSNMAPIPTIPLAISSQPSSERLLHTDARILMDVASMTACIAPLAAFPEPAAISFNEPTVESINARTPSIPLPSDSGSKLPIFLRAEARIRTEKEIPIIS